MIEMRPLNPLSQFVMLKRCLNLSGISITLERDFLLGLISGESLRRGHNGKAESHRSGRSRLGVALGSSTQVIAQLGLRVSTGEEATIGALAALLYALLSAAAVVAWVPVLAAASIGGAWGGGLIPLSIMALAWLGARLFGQPIARGRDAVGLIASALPMGLVAVAISLGMAAAAGATAGSEGKIAGAGLFLGGSLLIAGATFGEECLFRGLVQPLLCRAWGAVAGIAVASLAFTAIHFFGGWRDPVSLLNITLAGVWFGLLAWRTGGVLAPTLAHAGYNWAEEMLFGATPNPGVGDFGALFDIDLTGPMRLGGSGDGLNASLLLTAVLAAIILPLLVRLPLTAGQRMGRSS